MSKDNGHPSPIEAERLRGQINNLIANAYRVGHHDGRSGVPPEPEEGLCLATEQLLNLFAALSLPTPTVSGELERLREALAQITRLGLESTYGSHCYTMAKQIAFEALGPSSPDERGGHEQHNDTR